jgi:hypothetical protein
MQSLAASVAVLGFLVNVGILQVRPTTQLEPTKLEAFVTGASARMQWSKQVGRIVEGTTEAVVTALIIEDPQQLPHRMRGIRINLTNENARDQVYLDETRLEPVRNALLEIESDVDSFLKERDPTSYRYRGAAEFWRPNERIHTLNAAYFIRPGSSGLSLSAYKREEFRFPGHRPVELADLISQAIRELKAPR